MKRHKLPMFLFFDEFTGKPTFEGSLYTYINSGQWCGLCDNRQVVNVSPEKGTEALPVYALAIAKCSIDQLHLVCHECWDKHVKSVKDGIGILDENIKCDCVEKIMKKIIR